MLKRSANLNCDLVLREVISNLFSFKLFLSTRERRRDATGIHVTSGEDLAWQLSVRDTSRS